MGFCLPTDKIKKFTEALTSGKFDPFKLSDFPNSESRRAYFSQFVGESDAREVNALFESKLLLKNQQRGFITAAQQILGLKHPALRDFVSKIERMDKVLNVTSEKAFLKDLASKKLGTEVTLENVKKITELTQKAKETAKGPTNMAGTNDEHLKAREDLRSYIDSLKPSSQWKTDLKNLSVIGRNNLLANPSTPIKMGVSQAIGSVVEGITRRLSTTSLRGLVPEIAKVANTEAWATFRKTGFDTTRMENLDDKSTFIRGEDLRTSKLTGPTAPVSKGIQWLANESNKLVIDYEHNLLFTKVRQKTFFDMSNIAASDIVNKTTELTGPEAKAKAAEIVRDAARIEPLTDEGKVVRRVSQMQAERVTNTNDTIVSKLSLGFKKAVNQAIPGLGDFFLPIVKILSTLISNGIENAGGGIFKGLNDILRGRSDMQSEDLATKYQGMSRYQQGWQTLTRTIGSMAATYLIANQFSSKDYRTDTYGNHFARVGNTWINMEYFSLVSPGLAGLMSLKQTKGDIGNKIWAYVGGATSGIKALPGMDLLTTLPSKPTSAAIKQYAGGLVTSRGVPAFMLNLFKDRPVQRLFFGATGVETTQQYQQDKQKAAVKAAKTKRANARAKALGQ